MTINDYDEISEIWHNTSGMGLSEADSREQIQRFLERNRGLSLVCQDDGRIVATVLAGHDGRRGYIYHLAVVPEYRDKGIGKALIEKCLEQLSESGVDKCHLFVYRGNRLGEEFWNKTGWVKREDIWVFSKGI